jgi:hypothetical protein
MATERKGWRCAICDSVALEYRGERPYRCPSCGNHTWSDQVSVFVRHEDDALSDRRDRVAALAEKNKEQ